VTDRTKSPAKRFKKAVLILSAWLILAFVIGSLPGKRILEYRQLSKHGASTQGLFLGPYPHGQVKYSYMVGGRTYQGVGRPDEIAKPIYRIAAGETMAVHYLPEEPAISCLADPSELYSNDLIPALMASFLFPTAIIIAVIMRVLKRRRLRLSRQGSSAAPINEGSFN
jgi:hypothetical protein